MATISDECLVSRSFHEFARDGPHIQIKLVIAKHLTVLVCNEKPIGSRLYGGSQHGKRTVTFRHRFRQRFFYLIKLILRALPFPCFKDCPRRPYGCGVQQYFFLAFIHIVNFNHRAPMPASSISKAQDLTEVIYERRFRKNRRT
jgi:hypothetical protein